VVCLPKQLSIAAFALFTLFINSAQGAGLMSERPFQTILKLGFDRKFSEALEIAQNSYLNTEPSAVPHKMIFGHFAAIHLIRLSHTEEARVLILEMVKTLPDLTYEEGIVSFGQKGAVTRLAEVLLSNQKAEEAISFINEVLREKPEWREERTHRLASLFYTLGTAQAETGRFPEALISWQVARECWKSKTLLWREIEPEKYEKFKGLNRYNPLEIEVEASLYVGYKKQKQEAEARSILDAWSAHIYTMGVAHPDDAERSQAILRNTIKGKVVEQIKKWGVSGLEQDLSNYRTEMKCGALLVVSVK
jgi:tetratricopeptide (TPR) repeat protein